MSLVTGVGAIYVRRRPRVRIEPLQSGGGQERGIRSGTVPTPLVVGIGAACALAQEEMEVCGRSVNCHECFVINHVIYSGQSTVQYFNEFCNLRSFVFTVYLFIICMCIVWPGGHVVDCWTFGRGDCGSTPPGAVFQKRHSILSKKISGGVKDPSQGISMRLTELVISVSKLTVLPPCLAVITYFWNISSNIKCVRVSVCTWHARMCVI